MVEVDMIVLDDENPPFLDNENPVIDSLSVPSKLDSEASDDDDEGG